MKRAAVLFIIFCLSSAFIPLTNAGNLEAGNRHVATQPAVVEATLDGALAYEYLIDLTEIGSRNLESPTHQDAADFIISSLENMGYEPHI